MIRLDSVSKQHGSPDPVPRRLDGCISRARRSGSSARTAPARRTIFRMIVGKSSPTRARSRSTATSTVGYFSQDVGEMKGRSVVAETHGRRRRGRRRSAHELHAARARAWPIPARADELDAAGRALRRGAGALRGARRLRARGARARDPRRASASRRSRSTTTSARSRAAGRCASRSRASCSCSPTRCCSTSRPTTSTSSRSSGSRASCATTRARSS